MEPESIGCLLEGWIEPCVKGLGTIDALTGDNAEEFEDFRTGEECPEGTIY